MKPTSPFSRCIAIALVISVFAVACFAAGPAGQNPPLSAAAEKATRQIEKLRENEPLRVKLNDNSELLGCFKSSEADGFLFSEVGGSERKILFEDVAKLTRHKRGLLNILVSLGVVAGLMFGLVKVGGNTKKTVAVKVYVGMAIAYIALAQPHPPPPMCR